MPLPQQIQQAASQTDSSVHLASTLPSVRIQSAGTVSTHALFCGGRYALTECLGTGGNGTVYRAHDVLLDEWVALKVAHPSVLQQPAGAKNFYREVRLGRRVFHRNVAHMLDVGEDNGTPYLTMELVEGESLYALLPPGCPLPAIDEVVDVALKICAGLSAIHAAGIVHCDLNPQNFRREN